MKHGAMRRVCCQERVIIGNTHHDEQNTQTDADAPEPAAHRRIGKVWKVTWNQETNGGNAGASGEKRMGQHKPA